VRAALSALRELEPERLVAVFQRISTRDQGLAEQFGAALAVADEVAVSNVYPAREQPVGALGRCQRAAGRGGGGGADGGETGLVAADAEPPRRALDEILDRNRALGAEDQVLVTIGAGDIFKIGEALLERGDEAAAGGHRAGLPASRLTTIGPAATPTGLPAPPPRLSWSSCCVGCGRGDWS